MGLANVELSEEVRKSEGEWRMMLEYLFHHLPPYWFTQRTASLAEGHSSCRYLSHHGYSLWFPVTVPNAFPLIPRLSVKVPEKQWHLQLGQCEESLTKKLITEVGTDYWESTKDSTVSWD